MSNKRPSFGAFASIAAAGAVTGALVSWGASLFLKDMPLFVSLAAGGVSALIVLLALGAAMIMPSLKQYRVTFLKIAVMNKIFEAGSEAVVITDQNNLIRDVNPAFTHITGHTKQEVLGKDPGFMKSERHGPEFYRQMWEEINRDGRWQGEVWNLRKDGQPYPLWLSIRTLKGSDGKISKHIGVFTDITPLKESEELHDFLAHYDNLTHLPNRALFNDRLREAMARADKADLMVAVLLIDLDRFKYINDTVGHAAGDVMLKATGERIQNCVRKSDTVSRIGGDEFAVILTGVAKDRTAISVARKIVEAMHPIVKAGHHELRTTASVGITFYPLDGNKPRLLLKNAEIAMYHAKDAGHNTYRVFTNEMQAQVKEKMRVESNLRQAIEQDELVLHYQPQVDLKTGRMCGMEALVRRQESDWLVPPGVFIPIAEETGLIMEIEDWTLREACSQVKQWVDEGLNPPRVAVNIAATHFNSPNFVRDIKRVLGATGLSPSLLEIELTERVIMHQAEEVTKKINELKGMGLCLSIDDFGTGYSSLSYLKSFKVDKLKIDYSFIKDLIEGPKSGGATIVHAIISLAHNLGFSVIAEGVEKKEQLEFLINEGCDEVQGFYFSFPLPSDKFHKLLKENKSFSLST
ncbi:MAG TPA: EAL domain-containing protein [Nitrospirae bacterium]|nr:EAL domain-containing protein [Nitrospirota bacterium]